MRTPVKAHEGIIDYQKGFPEPGTVTTQIVKYAVCKNCRAVIMMGLCSRHCPHDGEHKEGTHVIAVYEQTNKFLRDE